MIKVRAEVGRRSGLLARICRPLLYSILAVYLCGRMLQVITGPTPHLSLVAVEVLAALAFAMIDGSRTMGVPGILFFVAIAVGCGNAVENVGVVTGFPFGHYQFLQVMGPKLLHVPVLLGFAYVGMGYACWTVARTLVGDEACVPATTIAAVPVVASFLMVAWDLAQDPVWSTMLHAWVWRDGGAWLGVPWSNFTGWFITNLLIFSLLRAFMPRQSAFTPAAGIPSIALYLTCAIGNILQFLARRDALIALDGAGQAWHVSSILAASAIVSGFLMGGLGLLALTRAVCSLRLATD